MLSPSERTLRAKIAGHAAAAAVDTTARAAKGAAGLLGRFEREIPAEVTDPAERARRAQQLYKAHMLRLAFKSAQARRKAAEPAAS